ncbi:putative SKP1/BTB/POZ domain, NPH3 domain-containing protein [Lupinus albus]|uniref:Putative SKP1/BTB/POZ domain, NPH3 domain-containing protein n=1 Tax=Lupinus albus TaxID=3870 RepID=A0A6A4NVY4_LUPAL|nr:putative SKP1/BTB/POZ domain, NPH3 domain-containing protein [Lupinus albus]
MVCENSLSCSKRSSPATTPKFCNSFTTRIFADVAGDITILIDGQSFLLHKFPLVTLSGKIRKMVAEAKGSNVSNLELLNFPGGHQTFELAMKFCYGMNFEITTFNVARLHCAAEFLEMTEEYKDQNLISRTQTYLNEIVFQSLQKSVEVLSTCEVMLPTIVDEIEIISNGCVEAIAMNACKEQLVSTLSKLDCDDGGGEEESRELITGTNCVAWWVEDLSVLHINSFQRVICAMLRKGVGSNSIIASLMHYAQSSLKGIGKSQFLNNPSSLENDQSVIVETLVTLLPIDKNKNSSTIPLTFLFGMLKMAIMLGATIQCRLELERRISLRMEMVSLDDLLIPSVQSGDSLFDVDTVHRLLENFLKRIEEEETEDYGYESDGFGSYTGHGSLLKVGQLIDAYLAEIAPDPYLSLQKFVALIEILPNYARVIDDGLYRAVDIYLKAHASLREEEIKKVWKLIECQKLSEEACNHAAQNERVPLQMVVQVLYLEQVRLKNSLSGSSGDIVMSQRISSGVPSAAMSPRDNYASLRRENRELKLEISRMRMRLSELEREQMVMKQGMVDKGGNGKTFFKNISKGIGRIAMFSGQAEEKKQKSSRKTGRSSRRFSQS